MNFSMKSALAGASLLATAMAGTAHADGTMPAYPFAFTGFVSGGGAWIDPENCSNCDYEIATIIGGGDFVIPITGYWNVQLGGAFRHDEFIFDGFSDGNTQFQGSGIGFWRDPNTGAFGIEFGMFAPSERADHNSLKIGGVAEFFINPMFTIGGFGGVLIPHEEFPFGPGVVQTDTGYYAGGHATYYASDTLAVAGYGRFLELNESFGMGAFEESLRAIRAGGKVRYLTSMPGVEVYGSAKYERCEFEFTRGGGSSTTNVEDGFSLMGGVQIRLGGDNTSLSQIDKTNAIDTRAWACDQGVR